MVKNPHLLDELRKRERKKTTDFSRDIAHYDGMYKLAVKLNPHFQEEERHLGHIIRLKEKFRKISKRL